MRNAGSHIQETVSAIDLFEGINDVAIDEIVRAAHVVKVGKGVFVYSSGDEARAFFHVLTGQMKVAVSSPDGGERVIDIVSTDETLGVSELFSDMPYISFAEAVVPTTLLQINRDAILRAMQHDGRLTQRILCAVARRQTHIERDIVASSFQSGCRRLVDYLVRLADPQPGQGDTTLELAVPKHLLASRLGFTPETLSRVFRYLSDAGLISVQGKQLTMSCKLFNGAADAVIEQGGAPRKTARNDRRQIPWMQPAARPAAAGAMAWLA